MQLTARGVHYGISPFSVSLLMNCKVFPSADKAEPGCLFSSAGGNGSQSISLGENREAVKTRAWPFIPHRAAHLSCMLAGWGVCVCVGRRIRPLESEWRTIPSSVWPETLALSCIMFSFVLLPQRSMNMHEKCLSFTEVYCLTATFEHRKHRSTV